MNLHDILHVALYEAKQQRRQWEFRLFVFIAVIGITLYQFFLQGQGYCSNWKMVALPCSVPLVNAYLYSVVQSLFVILMVTDFPRREKLGGALDPIHARPMENGEYTWGRVLGNMILFGAVNLLVMLCCVFFVNLNSMAPLGIQYYIFYFVTLNIPSLVFVMGLSLWLSRVFRWRYLTMVLLFLWCVVSVIWLPYRLHGILDFLGTGVPNLFSGVTGHVGLWYYLLHRLGFLLLGLGLLAYSVRGMERLPSTVKQVRRYSLGGVTLVVAGLLCGGVMAVSYIPARSARESYRESFRKHWIGMPCHVSSHDITLRQKGENLDVRSDLVVCNLNGKEVKQPLLFLNPGLRVTALEENGRALPFTRDGQVLVIDRSLASGDTLRLRVSYSGRIDERFTDLHIPDDSYEDSFRFDNFFPTGRRSAFVSDDYLLVTSACGWYPTALPPVNPVYPVCSGKDMTRFRLTVAHPRQRELFSQGIASTGADSSYFRPSHVLSGISLCGGQFETVELDIDSMKFVVSSFGIPAPLSEHFEALDLNGIKGYFEYFFKPVMKFVDLSWYEKEQPCYRLIETPLPFRTEFNEGRLISGQMEPGVVFLPEKEFDMKLMTVLNMPIEEPEPDLAFLGEGVALPERTPWAAGHMSMLFGSADNLFDNHECSHPILQLGFDRERTGFNLWNIHTLFASPRLSVYSEKYPYVGVLIDKLYSERKFILGHVGMYVPPEDARKINAYAREHSLEEAFLERGFPRVLLAGMMLSNVRDLVNYLGLEVSVDSLFRALDDIYHTRSGVIHFHELSRVLGERVGGDLERVFEKWIGVRHDQYFKVADMNSYFYPDDKVYGPGWIEIEAKVMNCGKEGGFVYMDMSERGEKKYYSCYVEPGKAKAFYMARRVERAYDLYGNFNSGMSINRPVDFDFVHGERSKPAGLAETPGRWVDTDIAAFLPDPNVTVVDDTDEGFSFDDRANQTILQKWFGVSREEVFGLVGRQELRYWTPVIRNNYEGDSLRRAYFKSFGKGDCSATWTARLKEKGKYRVMVKTNLEKISYGEMGLDYSDFTLAYTIKHGDQEEKIDFNMGEGVENRTIDDWMVLGEFDFPAGEVSVILSDKDERGRKDIVIMADAVKWVRM